MFKKTVFGLVVLCACAFGAKDRVTIPLQVRLQFQELDAELNPCTTPSDERATCVSLFKCPGLMKILGTLEKASVQFVQRSICPIGGAGELYVCCGTSDRLLQTPAPSPAVTPKPPPTKKPSKTSSTGAPKPLVDINAHREMVKDTLIPDRRYCGRQHTDDRFYNQTQTAIDEFPWLAHIKITDHEYESEYGDRCSGVLISNRYVLTDAYCAYHAIKVVLGEHKTDTNISCTVEANIPECTEPALEVRVEKIIRDGKRENGPFDFALLRLNNTLDYSEYIRPICLPFVQSERPQKNDELTFSGWGSKGPGVSTKKRLAYDHTIDQECFDAEVGIEGNVKFANVTLLCVKPKKTNIDQACNGDHGGALMFSRKFQWFAEGVVIQVHQPDYSCTDSLPASGIKITQKTLNWILDTIQP